MKLLYTVQETFSSEGYLKEQSKDYFNIPLYQRGYKWTEKEVRKLLDDINAFKNDDLKFYCLQNITIVPYEKVFNVVDGQQRLTTLTLLLSYLGEKELVKNKIRFPENSIRRETNDFINKVIIKQDNSITTETWEDFITKFPEYDHQDIFHLFSAYNTINNWFTSPNFIAKKEVFLTKLLNSVKLIVNKIETKSDEEDIFNNLNSKRVPLDGADLFRAIIITRVAQEEGRKEASLKDIIVLNERRIKIGWEYDDINNWWSQGNVINYFTRLISIKSDVTATDLKLFDTTKHPINLLLFLFAESLDQKQLTIELIEENSTSARTLYNKILHLHNTLVDWFEDREIYHYVGYLFANTKINFKTIWDKWIVYKDRSQFITFLKTEIKGVIFSENCEIDFTDPKIDWYHEENKLLVQVLILLDVIYSLDKNQPFMNPKYFTKNLNDIEHIFPQNPEKVKDKKEFVEFLNERISNDKFDLSKYEKYCSNEKYLEKVEVFISKHINSIKTNSIGNLVLLYNSLNRSIGNVSYTKKRAKVIDYFNSGNYIQPHTFRVFVRYFNNNTTETKELEHWTNLDIESNAKAINEKIKNFFNTI